MFVLLGKLQSDYAQFDECLSLSLSLFISVSLLYVCATTRNAINASIERVKRMKKSMQKKENKNIRTHTHSNMQTDTLMQ